MRKLCIDEVNFTGKRVLMRVDLDCPIEDGKVQTKQIKPASLESIQYVLKQNCQAVILISHLGHPDGKKDMQYSLKPISEELQTLLDRKVIFLEDCVGPEIELAVMEPKEGSVFLLENARFHIEEILKSEDGRVTACPAMVQEFRKSLRRLAEIYVNDCFAASHQAHSSMLGQFYEVRAAGFSILKELEFFSKTVLLDKPFLAILGGIKMEEQLELIDALLEKVDEIIIAGGIAFTFLKVCENMRIGNSLYFENCARKIPALMEKAKRKNVAIHFPSDFVTGDKMSNDAEVGRATKLTGIKRSHMGLDIGPKTVKEFSKIIRRAKILMWSGPMGSYEYEPFSLGTHDILEAVVDQTNAKGITIVSGDRTTIALEKWNAMDKVTFISAGTEATSALLKGNRMPGIDSLSDGDPHCRHKCEIFQVIRPKLEFSPFGQVDVGKIKEERRKKRDEVAKNIKAQEQRAAKQKEQQGSEESEEETDESDDDEQQEGDKKQKGGKAFLDRFNMKNVLRKKKKKDKQKGKDEKDDGKADEKGRTSFLDRLKIKNLFGKKKDDKKEQGEDQEGKEEKGEGGDEKVSDEKKKDDKKEGEEEKVEEGDEKVSDEKKNDDKKEQGEDEQGLEKKGEEGDEKVSDEKKKDDKEEQGEEK